MRSRDTSSEVQKIMDEHYLQMTPAQKGELVRRAWNTARVLQLTGLRARFPDESVAQLELRLAENWLGSELFGRVRARQAQLADE